MNDVVMGTIRFNAIMFVLLALLSCFPAWRCWLPGKCNPDAPGPHQSEAVELHRGIARGIGAGRKKIEMIASRQASGNAYPARS